GSEYDRAVHESGSKWRAESKLRQIEKRGHRLHIRSLSADERRRFAESWRAIQTRFVDSPESAVTEADALVAEVMNARGYPVGDFDQAAEDISPDHPLVVEHYRAGHEIAVRHASGGASTAELRQAMILYRTLFEDLSAEPGRVPVRRAS